ncbi:hypothetical protein C8R46DRAFT_1221990 [Mycena filopes]|nr:hypothetical protein C8R46DRAFT_1221986 [Mycena filopes]KAJ7163207.1 hypothetical protein C8R46DRAFT_1221990 [Mycena filopes]
MSALLALALAALLALFVAVPTRRRPSRRKPVRRPPRLRRFVERLKQLARRCVVCFKQAVLIPHDSLRRPPRLRRFLGRLKPLARRCFVRFKQAIRLAPTSRSLLGLDAEAQIKAHLKHRDLYASEGTGLVAIQRERCNKNGQTHLWLWWFRVQRRCVGERLCHLFGDRITPRTGLDCTGCTGTHRDYRQLSTMKCLVKMVKSASPPPPSSSRPLLATPAVVGTGVRSASTMVVFDLVLSKPLVERTLVEDASTPWSRDLPAFQPRRNGIPFPARSASSAGAAPPPARPRAIVPFSPPPTGSLFTIYDHQSVGRSSVISAP